MKKKLAVVLGVGAVLARPGLNRFRSRTGRLQGSQAGPKAGKSTALDVQIASSEPGQPQPPIMNRIVIKFNKGGKYNNAKFPRCNLASLQARGPNACPSGSKIGTGNGVGRALPVVEDPVAAKLTLFNGSKVGGKDTVFVYVFPDLGPTFVTVCKVSLKPSGEFRLHAGLLDPADQDAAECARRIGRHGQDQDPEKTIKKSGKKYPLIVAPKKCSGMWKTQAQFFFASGTTVTTLYFGEVLQVAGC